MDINSLERLSDKEIKAKLSNKNIYNAEYITVNYKSDIIYISKGYKCGYVFATRDGKKSTELFATNDVTPLTYEKYKEISIDRVFKNANKWSYDTYYNFVSKRFVEYYGEDRVDCDKGRNYITVYYPEVTIRNSAEQEHILRDIYLEYWISDSCIYLEYLYRATLTIGELANGYLFSHVNSGKRDLYSSSFCYGSETAIRNKVDRLKYNRAEVIKNLSTFFPLIDEYLQWESLEGVPYKHMDKILNGQWLYKDVTTKLPSNIEEITLEVMKHLDNFEYSFELSYQNQYKIVITSDINDKIIDIIKQYYPEHCYKVLNGQTVEKINDVETKFDDLEGKRVLTFKGQDIPFKIHREDYNELNLEYGPTRALVLSVVATIRGKFTDYLIKKKWQQNN